MKICFAYIDGWIHFNSVPEQVSCTEKLLQALLDNVQRGWLAFSKQLSWGKKTPFNALRVELWTYTSSYYMLLLLRCLLWISLKAERRITKVCYSTKHFASKLPITSMPPLLTKVYSPNFASAGKKKMWAVKFISFMRLILLSHFQCINSCA